MYVAFHRRGRPPRVYAIMKQWYRPAYVRLLNPSWEDMENGRGDFQTLYQKEEPHHPGLTLETHVDPDKVNDDIP